MHLFAAIAAKQAAALCGGLLFCRKQGVFASVFLSSKTVFSFESATNV